MRGLILALALASVHMSASRSGPVKLGMSASSVRDCRIHAEMVRCGGAGPGCGADWGCTGGDGAVVGRAVARGAVQAYPFVGLSFVLTAIFGVACCSTKRSAVAHRGNRGSWRRLAWSAS